MTPNIPTSLIQLKSVLSKVRSCLSCGSPPNPSLDIFAVSLCGLEHVGTMLSPCFPEGHNLVHHGKRWEWRWHRRECSWDSYVSQAWWKSIKCLLERKPAIIQLQGIGGTSSLCNLALKMHQHVKVMSVKAWEIPQVIFRDQLDVYQCTTRVFQHLPTNYKLSIYA